MIASSLSLRVLAVLALALATAMFVTPRAAAQAVEGGADAEADADAGAESAPAADEKEKTVKLPAAVDSISPAGGGRYLLLRLGKVNKLAVFDVTKDKIAGYAPLASTDMLVAGGMDKFLLVARDKGVVQRWSLEPLKKELTVALNVPGEIDGVVMGSASQGPALVMTRSGPRFLSLNNLKPVEFKKAEGRGGDWNPHPQYPIYAAASADGQTFAGWTRGLSPSGVRILQIQGDKLVGAYEHDTAGTLLPSWDGSLLFTGNGIYSSDLKQISPEQFRGKASIPTYQPSYFVGIGHDTAGTGRDISKTGPTLSIYTTGDRAMLVSLGAFPELGGGPGGPHDGATLGWHERVFVVPQHERIVTVNAERNAIVTRPFDIVAALDKAGIDYLFVESVPVNAARLGGKYAYPIKVKSKQGGVKFTLDSGPEGMTISADGQLTWDVPADREPGTEGVIVTIEDASGQSVFHTFNIQVEADRGAAKRPPAPQGSLERL